MGKVVINSYEDFEKLVGQQIGISDYVGKPVPQHNCPRLPDAVTPSSPLEPDHRGEQPKDDD